MLKVGPRKGIGTPVRCPSCRYPNLAIDIWCERCGTPLDWQRAQMTTEQPLAPEPPPAPDQPPYVAPILTPAGRRPFGVSSFPKVTLPSLTMPELQFPGWETLNARMRDSLSRLGVPFIPRTVGIVAVVVAALLLVPLAYLLLPAGRSTALHQAATHLAVTSANPASVSPQSAAIAGVEAKTGLRYGTKCGGGAPCLSITGQTIGVGAAALVFSTAASAGRECIAYVVRNGEKWRPLGTECGIPGQVAPLVGRTATVHVRGSCANVRDAANLKASVVACLHDGTTVRVDHGPVYADGFLWWQVSKGWMAHDLLVGP